MPLVNEIWASVDGVLEETREALRLAVGSIGGQWSSWRDQRTSDPVALALEVAERTATDGRQRALDHGPSSLEELRQLRLDVRDALRMTTSGPAVTPWVWNAQTTDGEPLTDAGREVGYELRFSLTRRNV